MTSEASTWDKVRATRNPKTEEHEISGRFTLGFFKRHDVRWAARGRGMGDASYAIDAVEHSPQGRVARALEPRDSFSVRLIKSTPAWEGYGSTRTVFLAELASDGLVAVDASVFEADDCEGDIGVPKAWSAGSELTPEQAVEGFESALADARFD